MWKSNFAETAQHFIDWWHHEGLVVGMGGVPASQGIRHELTTAPTPPSGIRETYTNGEYRAQHNHHQLAGLAFPADALPISETDIGPGSLALYLGSEPGFSPNTVWFEPCIENCPEPEALPPFSFDELNPWWKITESTLTACTQLAAGKYLVGCPDLVENIDILAALRTPQNLMTDMIERPDWVEQKVTEINQVWFEVYQRIYDIIKLDDGSAAFGAFRLWSPGKTAKLQCDASAMFSAEMFRRFVVPRLTEQCEWLDYSMYHLDGTQALGHLDALLEIDALDAIEWTPQAGIERGGHPRWISLYQRILDAGKSVQIVGATPDELLPILETLGGKGIYALTSFSSETEAEQFFSLIEQYR